MSSCKLDHSSEDVKKKLFEQQSFLPEEIYKISLNFIDQSPIQTELNELFHLLKKYDLSSEEVKAVRNEKIKQLVK